MTSGLFHQAHSQEKQSAHRPETPRATAQRSVDRVTDKMEKLFAKARQTQG